MARRRGLTQRASAFALVAVLSTGFAIAPGPRHEVGGALAQNASFPAPANFSAMVTERLPSVVGIVSTGPAPQSAPAPVPQLPPGLREFFGSPTPNPAPQGPMRSQGSGFIISSDGLVVTNNHVIEGAEHIEVVLSDDRQIEATLIGRDPATDIALLRLEGVSGLPAVSWGASDDLTIGAWVVAIGNPFGLGGSVTAGIVSARSRDINSGPYDDFIQTDAAINSGNSGGPLFDAEGNVVGVNTAIFSPTGGNVGIGFAVPSSVAERIVADLQDNGSVERGWLGVQVKEIDESLGKALNMEGVAEGVLIAHINDESPAARAGFRPGDVLLEVGNTSIEDPRALTFAIADLPVGEPVQVSYLRDGDRARAEVTIGLRTAAIRADDIPPASALPDATSGPQIGVTVAPLRDDLRAQANIPNDVIGLFVHDVAPDGAAAEAGLRPGDVLISADGEELPDIERLRQAIEFASSDDNLMLMRYFRGGNYGFTSVNLAEEELAEN